MSERKEKFKTYLEVHEELIDVAREWIEEFGHGYGLVYDISISVDNEKYPPIINAEYTYEYEGSCGSRAEVSGIVIPLSALWDDTAFERERKKREDANLAAREKQKEKDAKKARLDKAARYEQYLDLCKEFDDNS